MKGTHKQLAVALGLCALVLGTIAGAKAPVRRPLAWTGISTVVVDFSQVMTGGPITWKVESESGNMEHLGLYTSNGEGVLVFDSQGNMGLIGDGYLTAANGDKVFWHAERWGTNPFVLTFNGGTGRFLNATGTATEQTVVLSDVDWTITQSVTGTGTISY